MHVAIILCIINTQTLFTAEFFTDSPALKPWNWTSFMCLAGIHIYTLCLNVILPLPKSYGDNATVTLSPGKILIKNRLIFPAG